ncbi:MAG: T9SS type A sorting domain-containing protein [Dysgonamonadaceae bacterium]|jgi:hypothetical protein|nr:T9SS type A sorting domain-containing protein [Dysgonamonadaceae bacterium]
MKNLITILFCFTGSFGLYATVPMSNIGDMNVAGPMKSMGAFHLKAEGGQGTQKYQSRVINTGTIITDSLIFYSNYERDALLETLNTGAVRRLKLPTDLTDPTEPPRWVSVRKFLYGPKGKFSSPNYGEIDGADVWWHISFPFGVTRVRYNKTIDPATTTEDNGYLEAHLGDVGNDERPLDLGHYYLCAYDPAITALNFDHFDPNNNNYILSGWRDTCTTKIENGNEIPIDTFICKPGLGYMVAREGGTATPYDFEVGSLEFISAYDPNLSSTYVKNEEVKKAIKTALSYDAEKAVPLRCDVSPKYTYSFNTASGWNYIGSLNVSLFDLHKDFEQDYYYDVNDERKPTTHIGQSFNQVVYFREQRAADLPNFSFASVNLESVHALLRPYVPFYLQVDTTTFIDGNPPTPPTVYKSIEFDYKNGGEFVDAVKQRSGTIFQDLFRSSEATTGETKLELMLIPSDEDSKKVYIYLGDYYSNVYRPKEDAVQQFTQNKTVDGKNVTSLWTLAPQTIDGVTKQYPMFVNRLKSADQTYQEIPVGYTATAGNYTFDLSVNSSNIKEAVLRDKEVNKDHDLLNGPYEFSSGDVSGQSDRFVLFVNYSTVPIVSPKSTSVYAYVKDSQLTVANVEQGDNIRVLDLAGRAVVAGTATNTEYRCSLNQKGVYLVTVQGAKSTVIKVLNR